MAIKTSAWYNRFEIEWADGMSSDWLTDESERMRVMDGGMLQFDSKESPGGFLVVAPHTWNRLDVPSPGPKTFSTSGWTDNFYLVWAEDDHAPRPSGGQFLMKMMAGGLLLFESKEPPAHSVVFAPHTWKSVKGTFDFTK